MRLTQRKDQMIDPVEHDGVKLMSYGWAQQEAAIMRGPMVAGVVTTTTVAPVDVIKTQVMTSKGASVVGLCRDILATHGPLGFFKGWLPGYLRMCAATPRRRAAIALPLECASSSETRCVPMRAGARKRSSPS